MEEVGSWWWECRVESLGRRIRSALEHRIVPEELWLTDTVRWCQVLRTGDSLSLIAAQTGQNLAVEYQKASTVPVHL